MRTTGEMIQEILDNFDFEEMYKVMVFLDWNWFDNEVPTIEELKNKAKELLNKLHELLKKENKVSVCSGGFRVIGERVGETISLELLFECTSWECAIYGDEEKEGEGN